MSVLGVDLGGTKLAIAEFSEAGDVLDREVVSLRGKSGAEVGREIAAQIRKRHTPSIKAIGISVPGISRHKTGTVWAPNIEGWSDYPLIAEIRAEVKNLPVTMDSDRACSILGEQWQGNAKGCRDAIFLAVGTGIGAGILSDGVILRGAQDIGGAIGWMALRKPYDDKYKACGCFEYYASGQGIARYANEILRSDFPYSGPLQHFNADEISAAIIFSAYDQNDPVARKVIGECIELWGMAAANLVSLFNPEKILFGGGVFGPAARFIGEIKSEACRWAQPVSITQVSFEKSALAGDAAVYGAAFLALKNLV